MTSDGPFITRDAILLDRSATINSAQATRRDSWAQPRGTFDNFGSDKPFGEEVRNFGQNFRESFLPTVGFDWLMNNSVLTNIEDDRKKIRHETQMRNDAEVKHRPQYNAWEDPKFNTLPQEWQERYYDVESPEEADSIYQAFLKRNADLEQRNSGSAFVSAGAIAGELSNPGGVLTMLRIKSAKGWLGGIATLGVDEYALQATQTDRTAEQSFINIGLVGATGGSVLAAKKMYRMFETRRFRNSVEELQGLERSLDQDTLDDAAVMNGKVDGRVREGETDMDFVARDREAMERSLDDDLPFGDEPPMVGPDGKPAVVGSTSREVADVKDPGDIIMDAEVDAPAPKPSSTEKVVDDGDGIMPAMGTEKLPDGPVKRTLYDGSNVGKTIISELVEHPFYLRKNGVNQSGSHGVDRMVAIRWTTKMVSAMRDTEKLYLRYRQRVDGSNATTIIGQGIRDLSGKGDSMGFDEFLRAAGRAKRRLGDDVSGIEQEVLEAANTWHNKVYRPMGEDAKANGLFSRAFRDELAEKTNTFWAARKANKADERLDGMKEEIKALRLKIREIDSADIDPNYMNRIYRKEYIRENREAFKDVLRRHGVREESLDDTVDSVLGDRPRTPEEDMLGPGSDMLRKSDLTGRASSLKGRTLAYIPDEALEDFLEDNIFATGKYYTTRVAPDVELIKKFGSISLAPQIKKIRAEWQKKIDNAKGLERQKLEERMEAEIEDLKVVRDRIRGTYGLPDDPDSYTNRGLRVAKMYNAMTFLTGAMAAVPDMGRLVMYDGVTRTFGTLYDAFAKDVRVVMQGNKKRGVIGLANDEAELAGEALDMYMSMRASLFSDLSDAMSATSKFENIAAKATQQFFNASLMNPWNVGVKTMASLITGSRILDEAGKWASAGRNSAKATIEYGEVVSNRSNTRIAAKYNKKTNTVSLDLDKLRETYENKAWANPKWRKVQPMPEDQFKTFAEWRDFVIEHELAHADIRPRKGEANGVYETRINEAALRRAGSRGQPSTGYEQSKLSRVGIDENMAWRMSIQFEEHGVRKGRVRIAKTQNWTDREAAEAYSAALGKEINQIIVTPGAGDMPNAMSGGLGKIFKETDAKLRAKKDAGEDLTRVEKAQDFFMSPQMAQVLFQFKSFTTSATQRVLVPGLQNPDKNFLIGAGGAVALGMMITLIRDEQLGNNKPKGTGELIKSGIERSGILGYFSDINGMVETFSDNRFGLGPLVGENPRRSSAAYKASNLLGPSVSQAQNLSRLISGLSDGHVGKRDAKYGRRALLGNRVFWADGLFDYSEDLMAGAPK